MYSENIDFCLLICASLFSNFSPVDMYHFYNKKKCYLKSTKRGLPGVSVSKTLRFQCRGPGSFPGQGTRSHMLQLRVHMPQLLIISNNSEN